MAPRRPRQCRSPPHRTVEVPQLRTSPYDLSETPRPGDLSSSSPGTIMCAGRSLTDTGVMCARPVRRVLSPSCLLFWRHARALLRPGRASSRLLAGLVDAVEVVMVMELVVAE